MYLLIIIFKNNLNFQENEILINYLSGIQYTFFMLTAHVYDGKLFPELQENGGEKVHQHI